MDGFLKRLELLRLAFTHGPGLSIRQLAKAADVGVVCLMPSSGGPRTPELRLRIAEAAAALLAVPSDTMTAWLVSGEEVDGIPEYLAVIASQVACTKCKGWFDKGSDDYIAPLRRCRPCVREAQRERTNPGTARYPEELRRRLPEIRAVAPKVAQGVERQLDQPQEAVTYERIGQRIGWTAAEVGRVLKGLGLDKRKLSVGVVLAAVLASMLSSSLSLASTQGSL